MLRKGRGPCRFCSSMTAVGAVAADLGGGSCGGGARETPTLRYSLPTSTLPSLFADVSRRRLL